MAANTPVDESYLAEEGQALLAAIINSSDDAIISKSPDGIITSWNPGAERLFGYWAAEVLGRHIHILIPDDLQYEDIGIMERVGRGESINHHETVWKTKNGDLIDVSLSASPLRNKQGRIIGASRIVRDISAAKLVQRQLKHSNELLEQAEQQAGLGSWELNLVTKTGVWSRQMYRFFGFDETEPAPPFDVFLERVHPDDRHLLIREVSLAASGSKPARTCYRTNPAILPLRYLLPTARPQRDDQGNVVRFSGTLLDITEQKLADDKIAKSEKRFRALVENNEGIIIMVDKNLRPVYRSHAADRVLGYTTQDRMENSGLDTIHPDDLPRFKEHLDEVFANPGKPLRITFRMRHKQGHYIWLETTYTNFFDDPDIGAMVVNVRDITERKNALDELKESEAKYRALIEQATDAIFITDASFNYIDINPSGCQMLGYTKDEFLKLTPKEVVFKEDVKVNTVGTGSLLDGSAVRYERRLRRKDGTTVEVEINGKMLTDGRLILMAHDISQQKKARLLLQESEEKFSIAFQSSPVGLLMVREDDYITIDANDAFLKMAGYEKTDLLGYSALDFKFVEKGVEEEMISNLKNDENVKGREAPLRTKQGLQRHCLWTVVKLKIADQKVLLAAVMDITERKNAEEQIKQTYQELRALSNHLQNVREEERIQIARDIHDELGQQLTGLKMDVHSLAKKLENPGSMVKQKITDITALIDEAVKSVRKISANLRPSILDDLGLIAALEWQGSEVESRFGIKVNFVAETDDTGLEAGVSTNLFRIYQEALTNAVRHSNAREINGSLKNHGDSIMLEIRDNGKGMDVSKGRKGSLGLLGIKERVFVMGGKYEFKSEPGKGTHLTVSVPLNNDN